MLFDGSLTQAVAVLGAMRDVATVGGRLPLTEVDRTALIAANHIVFHQDETLDVDGMAAAEPAALAAVLTEADLATDALGYLTVMATVDGRVDDDRIERLRAYADALGQDPPFVDDLVDLAHDRLAEARADMVRRNLKSITGRWMGDDLDAWIMPYGNHPDPALEARYQALSGEPDGSFGRAFHDFYVANGFSFAGSPASANEGFTTPHDSAHVLSGYDTSLEGELLVSTFTAGMHPDEPIAGHILPVIVSWHLGIELVEFAGSATGSLRPAKFWRAWDRGDQITGDTFAPEWDFWAQVGRPLVDVREEMTVPTLDPADAADGHYPDWYTPTA